MPTPLFPERALLDVHCATDDDLALCGGNKAPRICLDQFAQLGTVLAITRHHPAWQRCRRCVDLVEGPLQ